MTPVEWAELRKLATIAHAAPHVGVRVRFDGQVVFDVGASPGNTSGVAAATIDACQFRAAVAKAWGERSRSDADGPLCDGGSSPLSIEVRLPGSAKALPGGILRVPVPSRHLYVFATSASTAVVRDETGAATHDLVEIAGVWGVGIRPDPATDMRLVYCEIDAAHQRTSEPEVVDLLQTLSARFAVRQLIEATTQRPHVRGSDGPST